jgi:16S rRNA (guanine1207-N2)-methyltransferase
LSDHYFSAQPAAAHRPGQVRVILPDVYLALATDAGVFSASRLDPGTRLLLDDAPPPPASGDLLDLGCGYGPIACVLAARSPAAAVWGVDVNERALELCARNAVTAGLPNVRAVPPDDPALPPRFTAIWSNPPVRIGKDALHALLSRWLGRLEAGGLAHLVVGRNLGSDSLHHWLADQGWAVTRLSARSGYRLLQVGFTAERAGASAP